MTTLKTTNIQGKEYVEVNERLKHFRSTYSGYSLISEVVDINDTSITIKATIFDDKQEELNSMRGEDEDEDEDEAEAEVYPNFPGAWGLFTGPR